MAVTVKGTAHVFGIAAGVGAVTNATVLSFSLDEEHQNQAQTVNEIGNEIERRYDDLAKTGSITLRIRAGYSVAAAATNLTYDSVAYIIESVGRAEEAQGFVVITYNIRTSEYISLA